MSNPEVVAWQVEHLVTPARDKGYDAVAWDNYGLDNGFQGCGVFRDGTWVQLYSGKTSGDTAYSNAMVAWLANVKKAVNALSTTSGRPMLVIPNFSVGGFKHDDPLVLAVAAATDGVLSEAGFSDYGCQPHCMTGADWAERVAFGLELQRMGVAYYPINEIGDVKHPTNWSLPCAVDKLNCITRAQREYVVGTYLLQKNNASAIYISGVQQPVNIVTLFSHRTRCIGTATARIPGSSFLRSVLQFHDRYGGWPKCEPECSAAVGTATGPAARDASTGVWSRRFHGGLVLVNPATPPATPVTVPLNSNEWRYTDVYGKAVSGAVELAPASAVILLRTPKGPGEESSSNQAPLVFLQWNPHWQCFDGHPSCQQGVESGLNGALSDYGVDVANLVMMEDAGYTPPSGYTQTATSTCGQDVQFFLYNSQQWAPVGGILQGCMAPGKNGLGDRSYSVQRFRRRATGTTVVVAGAHFPHPSQATIYEQGCQTLGRAINDLLAQTPSDESVILIADTNAGDAAGVYGNASSAEIVRLLDLNTNTKNLQSTALLKSCCLDPPGFVFEFDRVIATAGTGMDTKMLFDPTPEWAVGAFHKAILGTLHF